MELICQLYLFCFDGVRWFGDLTGVFAGVFGERFFRGSEEGDSVVSPIRLRSGLHSGLWQSGGASSRRVVYGTAEAVPLSKTGGERL